MEQVYHKYQTRSMAKARESVSEDVEREVKHDVEDDHHEEAESPQLPKESIRMLQQLLAQQNLLIDDNQQLRKEMKSQQRVIDNLAGSLESIRVDRGFSPKSSPMRIDIASIDITRSFRMDVAEDEDDESLSVGNRNRSIPTRTKGGH